MSVLGDFPPGYEHLREFAGPLVAVVCGDASHAAYPEVVAFFGFYKLSGWSVLPPKRIENRMWSGDLGQAVDPDTGVPYSAEAGHGHVERYNLKCRHSVQGRECGVTVPVRKVDRLYAALDDCATHGLPIILLAEVAAKL